MHLLEVIKANAFTAISWILKSITISGCPRLVAIQPKQNFPLYPFCKLESFVLQSCRFLKQASFLNSEFYNKRCPESITTSSFSVQLSNLSFFQSLGLRKPWRLHENTPLNLTIKHTPSLVDGLAISHFRHILNL